MQNIIKIHAWAEPYVNFLLGETSPFLVLQFDENFMKYETKIAKLQIPENVHIM